MREWKSLPACLCVLAILACRSPQGGDPGDASPEPSSPSPSPTASPTDAPTHYPLENVTGLVAVAGNGVVTLSWLEPAHPDFSAVEVSGSGFPSATVPKGSGGTTIGGLAGDVEYAFTVVSVYTDGDRSSGATATATPYRRYFIGGTAGGYFGNGLSIQLGNGPTRTITSPGAFSFPEGLVDGSPYEVRITAQPSGMSGSLYFGTGTVSGADVDGIRIFCPSYAFDTSVSGWRLRNAPFIPPVLSWSATVGSPREGALRLDLFSTVSSPFEITTDLPPALDATGLALTLRIRFDSFPNNPPTGFIELYAQDSGWKYCSTVAWFPEFELGVWKTMRLVLPSSGMNNWTVIRAWGLKLMPQATTTQDAVIYIDSVQFE